ncbi:MAG TPA: hypothetical protein VNK96_00895 [Fimbriimonadales bacterium]|nr:hypothetical protein [Fimbriimonadales bacterium]
MDKIVVIVKEVESWYLAGLDDDSYKRLGMKCFNVTDDTTKEQFNNVIPRKFNSRVDFMIEILNLFSIEIAKRKNKSFKYFCEKTCSRDLRDNETTDNIA